MNKGIIFTFLFFFCIAFVNAAQEEGLTPNNHDAIKKRVMAKAGEHLNHEGKRMLLEKIHNRIQLRSGNFSADCDCNLTQEQDQNRTRFYTGLSNGRNAEIKIMPDTASETALARLRLKLCENCTIELKETGKGNESRLTYELKTQKRARFLGLFRTRMQVQAQVDAENGEVIQVKRPWWSFLASEEDETQE